MTIWIDAQMSPAIAAWLRQTFPVNAASLRELGLRDATDHDIFFAARGASAIVMTKDADFLRLLEAHGAPPQVVWVTCGNTSNVRLKEVLTAALPKVLELLRAGEKLVEITAS